MGDHEPSDSSLRNQWISNLKTEASDQVEESTELAIEYDPSNVKFERDNDVHIVSWQEIEPDSPDDTDPLHIAKKKKRESSEDRANRLAKMSAYAAQRLANESPEQRAQRLKRMSEYAAKRLANETTEQRAKRLARMSEYAARRLMLETPDKRRERLARMSAYAAKRHAMKKMNSGNTSSCSDSNKTV